MIQLKTSFTHGKSLKSLKDVLEDLLKSVYSYTEYLERSTSLMKELHAKIDELEVLLDTKDLNAYRSQRKNNFYKFPQFLIFLQK